MFFIPYDEYHGSDLKEKYYGLDLNKDHFFLTSPKEIFQSVIEHLDNKAITRFALTCKEVLRIIQKNHSDGLFSRIDKLLIPYLEQSLKNNESRLKTFNSKTTIGFFNPRKGGRLFKAEIVFVILVSLVVIYELLSYYNNITAANSVVDNLANQLARNKFQLADMQQLLQDPDPNLRLPPAFHPRLQQLTHIVSVLNRLYSNAAQGASEFKSNFKDYIIIQIFALIVVFGAFLMGKWISNKVNAAAIIDDEILKIYNDTFNERVWQKILDENPKLYSLDNKQLTLEELYSELTDVHNSAIEALKQFKDYHQSLLLQGLQGNEVRFINLDSLGLTYDKIIERFIIEWNESNNEEQFQYRALKY